MHYDTRHRRFYYTHMNVSFIKKTKLRLLVSIINEGQDGKKTFLYIIHVIYTYLPGKDSYHHRRNITKMTCMDKVFKNCVGSRRLRNVQIYKCKTPAMFAFSVHNPKRHLDTSNNESTGASVFFFIFKI